MAYLILFLIKSFVNCQFKPFHACQVRACFEQSLLNCALRDQPWAALLYNGIIFLSFKFKKKWISIFFQLLGRPVCVCCSDERDARIAAGNLNFKIFFYLAIQNFNSKFF